MWIMTPFGILMPAKIPANVVAHGELQIRARDKRALTYLRKHYMPTLGKTMYTPNLDYEYRAYTWKADFAEAVTRMIEDIDYEKFKPESKWVDLHNLYTRIWGVVFDHYNPRGWDK